MKIYIFLLAVLFFTFQICEASPIVFKTVKNADSDNLTEIVKFDATKYKKIRIAIKYTPSIDLTDIAKRQLASRKELLDKGVISQSEFEETKKLLENSRTFSADVFALDKEDEYYLSTIPDNRKTNSILIDVPPVISIKVIGKGQYSIIIWGEL